jgi:hypothetical protein
MASPKSPSTGTVSAGARHLRAEWGRWWRAEDLTDTYVAHHVLNDQYRLWRSNVQRTKSEVQQNIHLMRRTQRQQQQMQMQRMAAMRHMSRGGRRGGGFGLGMMGGSSPMIAYKTMQWAELDIKIGQKEFEPTEVSPNMLAVGRGQLRARRHRKATVWMAVLPLLWVGAWALSATAGLLVTTLALLVWLTATWSAGRNPKRRRPVPPKLLFVPPKPVAGTEDDPQPEPFALREAGRTPRVAREAVRLALLKHGSSAEVELPVETTYGWRVPLLLRDGTIADVVRLLKKLATTLRVGENRILARPADAEDAARVELLLLTSDPFADPLPYPQRPPLSGTITAPVSLGLSIDGETTPVVLAGQHVIVVGNTGSGKSALVQAIAEYVTACADACLVDIDPFKRGLRSLAPLAARTARSPAEAEAVLEELLQLAQARIASMPPTQEAWTPTPEGPAVLAVLDEFPKFSARGKQLAIELLRVGREARVTIVLLSQDATEDVLGDSIADAFGVRVLMSCRAADVPLVVGRPDAVSRGWLPHLLVPSPDEHDPADAGQFYCITPKHRSPVLRYVSKLPAEAAARLAKERLAAGLPALALPGGQGTAASSSEGAPEIVRQLLDAFASAENPELMTIAQLADPLVALDAETWGQWEGRHNRRTMIGRRIREKLKAAGVDVTPIRIEGPGRPTAYRLADLRDALG